MDRRQHFLSLVEHVIRTDDLGMGPSFALLDCAHGMPERCIPGTKSLRDFTMGFINHFMGDDNDFAFAYGRACRYVEWWKGRCLPSTRPTTVEG